jgi:hypothetical protein
MAFNNIKRLLFIVINIILGAACPSERHARKDRVGKAAGAGVQLLEQESGAYRVKREMTQRARPQDKLAREHYSA